MKKNTNNLIPGERIINRIFLIRGIKVMIDRDLAELYEVETGALNRAVKRNMERFPNDFMFQLTLNEFESLRCQFGTSNWTSQSLMSSKGGRRYLPYAFTEQGVAMLSSVLNSERAIMVNIQIIRTFTKLKEFLATNKQLREKIEKMEKKYDGQFKEVFAVLKKFFTQEEKPKKQIGFRV
jgi:phage regulator Rha-like protein